MTALLSQLNNICKYNCHEMCYVCGIMHLNDGKRTVIHVKKVIHSIRQSVRNVIALCTHRLVFFFGGKYSMYRLMYTYWNDSPALALLVSIVSNSGDFYAVFSSLVFPWLFLSLFVPVPILTDVYYCCY